METCEIQVRVSVNHWVTDSPTGDSRRWLTHCGTGCRGAGRLLSGPRNQLATPSPGRGIIESVDMGEACERWVGKSWWFQDPGRSQEQRDALGLWLRR